MSNDFSKSPAGAYPPSPKRRKRVMRAFKINEISAVDTPAQEHATMSILKRADKVEPVEKVMLLSTEVDGHQHSVDIDAYCLKKGGGSTSYTGGKESHHSHDFVINPDGTIALGMSNDHTHEIEIGDLLARLNLERALSSEQTRPETVRMRKSEDEEEFAASDFALVPDAKDPRTWKYRLVRKSGSNPDRRLVGNAVAALRKGQIEKCDTASFTRRVRSAWTKSHKGRSKSEMPSVLKRVFS